MNITVALALNYTKTSIAPFLQSYEKYASGPLYIITDRLDQYQGFTKIKPINIYDFIKKYNIQLNYLTPYNLKPIIYYLFLKDFSESCTNVFLTDVDVVFQKDPFSILDEISTETFIICEEAKLYRECDTNTTWFNMGYREHYDKVKDNKILNCGLTLGSKDTILDYQKQVSIELQKVLARQYYFAYDQVILNVLYYVNNSIKPTILPHGNNHMIHLAHVQDNELTSNNIINNQLINTNNVPYPIVHQFNERPVLNEMYNKLYS